MKTKIIIALFSVLFLSCRSGRKVTYDGGSYQPKATENTEIESAQVEPIVIKEEVVIAAENYPEIKSHEIYFVILGSFRVLENAKKFQSQINKEGFSSQLLQNEQGLYRVSVFSYEMISEARQKVFFIRNQHPKYSDVWLLRKQ